MRKPLALDIFALFIGVVVSAVLASIAIVTHAMPLYLSIACAVCIVVGAFVTRLSDK